MQSVHPAVRTLTRLQHNPGEDFWTAVCTLYIRHASCHPTVLPATPLVVLLDSLHVCRFTPSPAFMQLMEDQVSFDTLLQMSHVELSHHACYQLLPAICLISAIP